jgi:hypothetical protein
MKELKKFIKNHNKEEKVNVEKEKQMTKKRNMHDS